jgi:transposase
MARTHEVFVTDEQWERIKPHLPKRRRSPRGGRPPADDRACLEGILWVLRSGARWKDLPERYPSPSTCWRRLREWEGEGILVKIWHAFLDSLDEQGLLDWDEVFVDASFSPAKKGATESAKPSAERVQSGWWWQMVKEFHWHAGPKVLRLLRSRWSKASSKTSRSATNRRR